MKMPKKVRWPVAAEREVKRLEERVAELEEAARKAHDYLADLAGRLGTNPHTADMDERAFAPLCKVLFGIGPG